MTREEAILSGYHYAVVVDYYRKPEDKINDLTPDCTEVLGYYNDYPEACSVFRDSFHYIEKDTAVGICKYNQTYDYWEFVNYEK